MKGFGIARAMSDITIIPTLFLALLEEPQKEKDATALKEVKDMYAACLNEGKSSNFC